jgi:hypothetical protein
MKRKNRRIGRSVVRQSILALIVALLDLPGFPLGGYSFWVFLSQYGPSYFRRPANASKAKRFFFFSPEASYKLTAFDFEELKSTTRTFYFFKGIFSLGQNSSLSVQIFLSRSQLL